MTGAPDTEARAGERLDRGDLRGAATVLIRDYGPEVYGYLLARLRDETAANEAFSIFTEDLWRGLPGFERRASLRVWAYTLARHAAIRYAAAPHRRRARNLPLSDFEALSELADAARTDTLPYLRTEMKSELARLPESTTALYRYTVPFLLIMAAGLFIVDAWPSLSTFTVARDIAEARARAEKLGEPPREAWALTCVQEDRNDPIPCTEGERRRYGR